MELSVTSVLKLGALPIAESAKTQMFEPHTSVQTTDLSCSPNPQPPHPPPKLISDTYWW